MEFLPVGKSCQIVTLISCRQENLARRGPFPSESWRGSISKLQQRWGTDGEIAHVHSENSLRRSQSLQGHRPRQPTNSDETRSTRTLNHSEVWWGGTKEVAGCEESPAPFFCAKPNR